MSESVKLVDCTEKHAALLAELGGTTFYEAFSPFHAEEDMQLYITKTYAIPKMKENLHNPAIIYVAAYYRGKDMGYIKLLEEADVKGLAGRVMELEKIYVRKEAHGTPVGSELMKRAIEIAQSKDYDQLFLGVWQENHRALAFYKKFGYEVFDTRTFQLGTQLCHDFLFRLALK